MEFTCSTMTTGYPAVCHTILQKGEHVAPRGLNTREILNPVILLLKPHVALPIGTGRNLHPGIAAAEALQLIGGVSHPELMRRISPTFSKFYDGQVFHAPYGPRTRAQIPQVIRRLADDRDTRQAVMTIWDPALDLQDGMRDYPCTVMLQFMIRNDRLNLHVTMRSNDAWLGLPYDMFQFTQLQVSVAQALMVDVGYYFHNVNSLHLYEPQWNMAELLKTPSETFQDYPPFDGWWRIAPDDDPVTRWQYITARARQLLVGEALGSSTPKEEWYERELKAYVG